MPFLQLHKKLVSLNWMPHRPKQRFYTLRRSRVRHAQFECLACGGLDVNSHAPESKSDAIGLRWCAVRITISARARAKAMPLWDRHDRHENAKSCQSIVELLQNQTACGSWLMGDPGMAAWGLLGPHQFHGSWLSGPVRSRRCSWPLD